MFLDDLHAKFSADEFSAAANNGDNSALSEPSSASWLYHNYQRRKDEDSKKDAFVKLGQTLKLESVLRGEVSQSLDQSRRRGSSENSSALSPSSMQPPPSPPGSTAKAGGPWEPACIFSSFKHEIVCGDSWANAHLIICTADAGTFLIAHRRPPVTYHRRKKDCLLHVVDRSVKMIFVYPSTTPLHIDGDIMRVCKQWVASHECERGAFPRQMKDKHERIIGWPPHRSSFSKILLWSRACCAT